MFERYTERARHITVAAQDEARLLRHNYIGTEHLLIALIREEGVAGRVLASLGIAAEEVRAQVRNIVGQGDEVTTGQIPFSPYAKKAMEHALREALSLGHNYIGPEHLLLGLSRENVGTAARILMEFDVDGEKIRSEVIRLLSGNRQSRVTLAEAEAALQRKKAERDSRTSPVIDWSKLTLEETGTLVDLLRKALPHPE